MTILETADISLAFTKLRIWPKGCTFSLVATLSDRAANEPLWPHLLTEGRRSPSGSIWEAGGMLFPLIVTTALGTEYPVRNANEDSSHEDGLFSLSAHGLNDVWEESYWLTPLPAGPLALTVNWPAIDLARSITLPANLFTQPGCTVKY